MRYAFVCALFMLNIGKAATPTPSDSIGYYQNMSTMFFVYGTTITLEMEHVDPEMRVGTGKQMAYVAFVYWCHTRIGDLTPSKKVDVAIRRTYQQFMVDPLFREHDVFKDPTGQPGRSLPSVISSVNKVEYQEILRRFKRFLEQEEDP
jgi:hypothetical protein